VKVSAFYVALLTPEVDMKVKSLLSATICFASVANANAQSSVTLSGILDSGLLYSTNASGKPMLSTTSGQLVPSRFIFSGVEDIGNGQSIIFKLIDPFNLQTGKSTGRAFNIAYVGLSDARLGSITLGRQWDSTIDLVSGFASNEIWSGYIGSHVGDADNLNATFKVSNAVKYMSPLTAGLQASATYGFSNNTNFSLNRILSFAAAYNFSGFASSIGFVDVDRPDSQNSGAVGTAGSATGDDYSNVFSFSEGKAGVEQQRIYLAGASYDFSSFTIRGIYSNTNFTYIDGDNLRLQNVEFGFTYHVNPALNLSTAFTYTNGTYKGSQEASPNWKQLNLGGQYFLSKRTSFYLIIVGQIAGGGANAQIWGITPSSNNRQIALTAGVQHKF
jgi:general bacterial porin, GBP family